MMAVLPPSYRPTEELAAVRALIASGRRLAAHGKDRINDVLVTGAPAEIALEPPANTLFVRMRLTLKQFERAHDHAWRAETTLQRMMLAKRRQQRMLNIARIAQALDGVDDCAVRLDG